MSSTALVFPPLYARWSDALFGAPVPNEPLATCSDCAMCAEDEGQLLSDVGTRMAPYRADTKCCTFMPNLPNFLVGRALAEDPPDEVAAEGRRSLEARIDAGVGVVPQGLLMTPAYSILYDHKAPSAFGRTRALRCPHYVERDGGMCGIWRHRNAVCSTWFCKHQRGGAGRRFWRDTLALLTRVEQQLAAWCVLELDLGVTALRALFPVDGTPAFQSLTPAAIDGVPDPESHAKLWGRWAGREREFYARSAALVDALAWEDVVRICGARTGVDTAVARASFEVLTAPFRVPPKLALAAVQMTPVGSAVTRVRVTGGTPIDLPNALAAQLTRFDGRRPTPEVLLDIAVATRTGLPSGLLRQLVEGGVLADAEGRSAAAPGRALPVLHAQSDRVPVAGFSA